MSILICYLCDKNQILYHCCVLCTYMEARLASFLNIPGGRLRRLLSYRDLSKINLSNSKYFYEVKVKYAKQFDKPILIVIEQMDKSVMKWVLHFEIIYWNTYRRSSLFWCLKTSVERQEMLFLLSSLKSKWRCRKIIYEVKIRFLTADTLHNSMLITKSLTSCWDPWGPPELERAGSPASCQIKFCKK